MDTGLAVLIGVFVLAGVCFLLKVRAGRANEARLRELGFEPCEEEAARLRDAYARLAGGHLPGQARRFDVARCYRKRAGAGFVYRFAAADLSVRERASDERASVVPVSDVFLLEPKDGARAVLRPCSLFLSGLGGGVLHSLLARALAARPLGRVLELPAALKDAFLAAFGAEAGPLEQHLAPSTLERLAGAARAGFFAVHLDAGRVAFEAPQGVRDVDAQWNYLADWL